MQTTLQVASVPNKKLVWTGRILSAFVILFLFFDSLGKLMRAAAVVKGTGELGFSTSAILPIGVVLLVCTLLYAWPRTSVLGGILLTGYLGGAVAVQVRVEHPLFGYVLFPVYVGILMWAGLFVRDRKLQELIPWRKGF